MIKNFFLTLFLVIGLTAFSQTFYPEGYFRAPVDFRMLLSGTFGELRGDHFHSGIDIKTGGVTGKNIYAIADGYVSRIKISPFGFGKAVYITHPNGFVSVYGHLKSFSKEIMEYTVKEQYRQESYSIDVAVPEGVLPVSGGEVIALSGNSGSTAGPHLHFEIRDAASQKPVNPLLFGYEIKDWIRPKITSLKVYPVNSTSKIDGINDTVEYALGGWGPEYRIKDNDTIHISGDASFGIITYDLLNDASNKNGIYSVDLFVDSNHVFSIVSDKFSFAETRYINSLIDYSEYIKTNRRFYRTYRSPNNRLSIYKTLKNNGVLSFSEDRIYLLQFVVKDLNQNTSVLTFRVRGEVSDPGRINDLLPVTSGVHFHYDKENRNENDEYRLVVPEGALYEDINYIYDFREGNGDMISRIHSIHNKSTPVHTSAVLSIKYLLSGNLDITKAYIARIDNGNFYYCGGTPENDFLTTRINSFGDYCIMIDSIPPVIDLINFHNNKDCSSMSELIIRISDEDTGIQSYRGTINGQWILMEYDPKKELLIYRIDDRMSNGLNYFRLEVFDNLNNESVVEAKIIYK